MVARYADAQILFAGHLDDLLATGVPEVSSRVIDWGGASVGFPLGTMLCTLNSVVYHAGVEPDDPRVVRVRDAYPEPFAECAGADELVRYVDLARRTGCVTMAMSYRAALADEPLSTHLERDRPVRGWSLSSSACDRWGGK